MDMIERAARALCYADRDNQYCARVCTKTGVCGLDKEDLDTDSVRAVLSALREPSAAMLDAGYEARDNERRVSDIWQAMIDQALKG